MYDDIKRSAVEETIREEARAVMDYARKGLTDYQREVNRSKVTKHDNVRWMGGLCYPQSTAALESLANIAEKLSCNRLADIIVKHIERLERDFTALYNRDSAQVKAAKEKATEEFLANIRKGR